MSAKLISCLLASCVVAVGGMFLIHGKCPFSGSCDSSSPMVCTVCSESACPSDVSVSCCPDSEDSAICPVSKTAKINKKVCCEGEACCSTQEPIAAAFGGAVASTTK